MSGQDSKDKYKDVTINAGVISKGKRDEAAEAKRRKKEEDKRVDSIAGSLAAGTSARERRGKE